MTTMINTNDGMLFENLRSQFAESLKHEPTMTPEKFSDRCARMTREAVMEILTGKSVFAPRAALDGLKTDLKFRAIDPAQG